MEDEVNVVDVLADEYFRILMWIYNDPLQVTQKTIAEGSRGDIHFDSYCVEIKGNQNWCHCRDEEELTTTRVGRLFISPHWVKVGRLKGIKILLSDPTLFEQSLMFLHDDLTNYLLCQSHNMKTTQRLCGFYTGRSDFHDSSNIQNKEYWQVATSDFDLRIKLNHEIVELFDLRYLSHMYSTKYLGWESIPDMITLGERNDGSPQVEHRSYSKKQIICYDTNS